jgi:hypothetical protein
MGYSFGDGLRIPKTREVIAKLAGNRSLTVAALKGYQLTEPRASASGLSASFAITS